MPGPPKNVESSELFQSLMAMPRPNEVVDFPRVDRRGKPVARIRIFVLSQADHETARRMALERLKKKGLSVEDQRTALGESLSGDASAKEILAMACHEEKFAGTEDAPIYIRVFKDASEVEQLSSDEVAALFNSYINVQYKYGPFDKTVTTEQELSDWIKRLKEGASSDPLVHVSLPALADLALRLAKRAWRLGAALESQWSNLPPSLVASLDGCSLGTGFFGEHAESSIGESDDE